MNIDQYLSKSQLLNPNLNNLLSLDFVYILVELLNFIEEFPSDFSVDFLV
jgi:hypothetical protein